MEIKIIEEKGNRLEFEINENVGFLNALKAELQNEGGVKVSTFFVKHQLIGRPKMIIEADDPRKSLANAINRLKKLNSKFAEDTKTEIK